MAATCDVQALLDANPCMASLNPMDLEMIKYGLLCRIWERVQGGAATDCSIQDILDETKCARVLYPTNLQAVETQLVLNIAGYVGLPSVDPCLASLSPWFLQLVITALLCQIAAIIDGGEPLPECDIQTLLDTASCYNDLSPFILSRLQASQLCYINQNIPDTPPTPPTCTLAISTQPSDFTGDAGADFSLTVGWSGALGTPTVQWQRDDGGGGWIDVVDGTFDGATASGAQTPTLTVTNAQVAQSGSFRAIVTDPAIASCTATSNTATVTINPATGNGLLVGLTAFWRFEEPSGPAYDSSGNGHTLTQHGTIASDNGIVQLARTYSKDDHFYFSNSSPDFDRPSDPFSITGWAKFSFHPLDVNDYTIIAKGSYPDGTLAWWLILDHGNPNDLVTFYYTTDGLTLQSLSFTFDGFASPSVWYFIAVRWDGSTIKLSVTPETDSVLAADVTATFAGPFYSTADPLVVGDMPGDTLHAMDGSIDELGYWSLALSDCELGYLFSAKAGSFSYPDMNADVCA